MCQLDLTPNEDCACSGLKHIKSVILCELHLMVSKWLTYEQECLVMEFFNINEKGMSEVECHVFYNP